MFFAPLLHFWFLPEKSENKHYGLCYLKVSVVIFFGKTFIQPLLFSIMSLFLQKLKKKKAVGKRTFCNKSQS